MLKILGQPLDGDDIGERGEEREREGWERRNEEESGGEQEE